MQTSSQKLLTGIKKASSLLKKIQTMVQENAYCIDTIQQNLAVIGLLKSANEQLLAGHLQHCFKHAMTHSDQEQQQKMIAELLKVMKTAQKR